jgi:predicted DNA repair protein MutK
MASGIFLLLDDIALLADDVAVATKIATKKTVGILGDDIAVSAQKATGFNQQRELQIIWAITKGSLKNKLIILPMAFLLSIFASFLIPYILIAGAFYLLYGGVDTIKRYLYLKIFKKTNTNHSKELHNSTSENILDIEKQKIKSAIFTDFILSIEIIIIALSAVLDQSLPMQILAVCFVAIVATFGVYGLVAAIVRIDNVGFWLIKKDHIKSGNFLISLMPRIINILSVIGTIAMILVGGDILIHNIPYLHHTLHSSILNSLIVGSIGGGFSILLHKLFYNKIKGKK